MKDLEKEFYAHLGLLSIKFAEMEYLLQVVTICLLKLEDDTKGALIVQDNALAKNVQLLEKINDMGSEFEDTINILLKRIEELRKKRNMFIHGIWKEPELIKGEVHILCEDRTFHRVKSKEFDKKNNSKTWKHSKHEDYTLTSIKKDISMLDKIIHIQKALILKYDKESLLPSK